MEYKANPIMRGTVSRKYKKRMIGNLVIFLLVLFLAATYILIHPEKARAEIFKPKLQYEQKGLHMVAAGDTLWGIAEEFCDESVDIRLVVEEIMEINNVTADIYPGMILEVPVIKGR